MCASVHTHTHTCTFLLYTLSIKDVGRDLEMMLLRCDRFGLAYDSSPFHWSFTTSCPWSTHQVLLIRSIHLSVDPPGLLLILLWSTSQGLLLGAMVRHPLHFALPLHLPLPQLCSSTGNLPVSFRMSTFRYMFQSTG